MKHVVIDLEGAEQGSVELDETIFGLEPRADILHRMVQYQLAKRQSGNHKTKGRSEIARTGKKFGKQKGGGGARHGSRRAPIFIGGGKAHGPVPRSHAIDLPKKIRALALRHALSAKVKSGELAVVSEAVSSGKTSELKSKMSNLGWSNALIVDGSEVNSEFSRAARNIENVDVLPIQGANVYDILRRKQLVLTKAAVEALEARFNG